MPSSGRGPATAGRARRMILSGQLKAHPCDHLAAATGDRNNALTAGMSTRRVTNQISRHSNQLAITDSGWSHSTTHEDQLCPSTPIAWTVQRNRSSPDHTATTRPGRAAQASPVRTPISGMNSPSPQPSASPATQPMPSCAHSPFPCWPRPSQSCRPPHCSPRYTASRSRSV